MRGESESIWLERHQARLTIRVLGAGGGEIEWSDSAFSDVAPLRAFEQLGDRIEVVALFSGGPFPEDLMAVFAPDEAGPATRYRAEWPGWAAFLKWLSPAAV